MTINVYIYIYISFSLSLALSLLVRLLCNNNVFFFVFLIIFFVLAVTSRDFGELLSDNLMQNTHVNVCAFWTWLPFGPIFVLKNARCYPRFSELPGSFSRLCESLQRRRGWHSFPLILSFQIDSQFVTLKKKKFIARRLLPFFLPSFLCQTNKKKTRKYSEWLHAFYSHNFHFALTCIDTAMYLARWRHTPTHAHTCRQMNYADVLTRAAEIPNDTKGPNPGRSKGACGYSKYTAKSGVYWRQKDRGN